MKITSDWISSLHKLRIREIDLIFGKCPEKFLREGLELGAGDGFQSQLLTKCVFHLIATDYDLNRLCRSDSKQITYMKCDAEKVGYSFGPRQFDFIFSSSLLEHLPHPKKALIGIHKVLKDDGITIHCMPNSFWKFTQIFMFYPNLFMNIFERLTTPGWLRGFIEKQKKGSVKLFSVDIDFNNNPKTESFNKLNLLYPQPHGVCKNHIKEFFAFRKASWLKEFEKAGFMIVRVVKGPVASGYGFGFDKVRKIFERIGCSSEYIYVAVKKGMRSPYLRYFGI